jgi:hypothetical protein
MSKIVSPGGNASAMGVPSAGPVLQDQQPIVPAAQPQLVWRTHHAVGRLPANFRLLDLKIPR